jgi:hypothetical protein
MCFQWKMVQTDTFFELVVQDTAADAINMALEIFSQN